MDIASIAEIIVVAALGVPALVIGSTYTIGIYKSSQRKDERENQLASINHAQTMANLSMISTQSASQTAQTADMGISSTDKKTTI